MMKSKILATVIYNIVFWALFLLSYIKFEMNWSGVAILLYSVGMPAIFHLVYFVIFPKEEMEQKWLAYQVFIQIMITVICTVGMSCYIEYHFGPYGGWMSSRGREVFVASVIELYGTLGFIFARITSAFLE